MGGCLKFIKGFPRPHSPPSATTAKPREPGCLRAGAAQCGSCPRRVWDAAAEKPHAGIIGSDPALTCAAWKKARSPLQTGGPVGAGSFGTPTCDYRAAEPVGVSGPWGHKPLPCPPPPQPWPGEEMDRQTSLRGGGIPLASQVVTNMTSQGP